MIPIPPLPDWAKKVLAILGAVAGIVVVQFPGTKLATYAGYVFAILSAAGLVSGGVSNQRSDQSREIRGVLLDKKVIP